MYKLLTINDQVLIKLLKSNGYISCRFCKLGNKIKSVCESCKDEHSNEVYRNITLFNMIRLEIKFNDYIKAKYYL